jgi:hypothetical protein
MSVSEKLKDPSALSPRSKLLLGLIIALPLLAVLIYWAISSRPGGSGGKIVDWGMYRQYDPTTNTAPPELAALDGHKIRSPGFMVPLEDNRSEVTEFLLVPNPQACIHAPPPPSNQMVYVRMVGAPAKTIFGPIMLEGTLRVSAHSHLYGTASFQIYGENVEPYRDR